MRCGLLHRADHTRMRVADDRRAPRADVIDIALAVGVPQIRALAAHEKPRRSADRAKSPHGRIDAGRNRSLCTREKVVVAAHQWTPDGCVQIVAIECAADLTSLTSACRKTALMTATASAPASINVRALLSSMPPIAITGTPSS